MDRLKALGVEVFAIKGFELGGVASPAAAVASPGADRSRKRRQSGHAQQWPLRAAAQAAHRVPVLAIYHGGKIQRFFGADRIITINDPQRLALIEAGYPAERVAVVDNVLPIDTMPPFIARPPTTYPVIGTLRLLEPAKGVDTLIEAVATAGGARVAADDADRFQREPRGQAAGAGH